MPTELFYVDFWVIVHRCLLRMKVIIGDKITRKVIMGLMVSEMSACNTMPYRNYTKLVAQEFKMFLYPQLFLFEHRL